MGALSTKIKRLKLSRLIYHKAPVIGVVVVFASLGITLLSASKADTPVDGAVASITLAPANVAVEQGQIINIAVNLDTHGQVAQNAEATVQFPSAAVELQSVQTVCTDSIFRGVSKKETHTVGKVVIGCDGGQGIIGQHTMATLVFKALTSSSEAPITVSDASTVIRMTDSKKVLGSRSGAQMKLEAHNKSDTKQQRDIPDYKSRNVCSDPAPDQVHCNAVLAVNSEGGEITSAAAATSGYGPTEFHAAYRMPCTPGGPIAAVCATPSTYGPQTIAVVDTGDYTGGPAGLEADLQTYNQKYGIAACTRASGCLSVVNQSGGTSLPPVNGTWPLEIALDVQAAHMMCQTCKIIFVESTSTTNASMGAAQKYAASLKPTVISDSWSGGSASLLSDFQNPGIPQIVSAGDNGVLTTVNDPLDFSDIIGVAGTKLSINTDGSWAGETLWSTIPSDSLHRGSGGGCSPTGAAPSWQTSLPNWSTAGCGTKRAYGDMSADGDPASGAAIYNGGMWQQLGGTSLSAPLIAGMFALAGGIPANTVAPTILYANNSAANFHDITSGNDCVSGVTAHCTAGPGFDVPSGLGSPTGLSTFKTSVSITPAPPTPPTGGGKTGDINGDGKVDITDLSMLLSAYGTTNAAADLNKNGKVDIADLSILLSNYGK